MLHPSHRLAAGLARRALGFTPIGQTFCGVTHGLGMDALSRRASRFAHYVPQQVEFNVADSLGGTQVGKMSSANGSDYIARRIWTYGLNEYEPPLPEIFMRAVRGCKTIFDVGANSGLYTLIAALAEPHCRIHAFEPYPEAFKCLSANIALNALESRVALNQNAVGARNDLVNFYVPLKQFGETLETSSSLYPGFRKQHSDILKVELITLDDYIRENSIARVDLLRIDVEAAEPMVLAGASALLKEHRPLVLLEVLADSVARELEPLRARADYQCVLLHRNCMTESAHVVYSKDNDNELWYPTERHDEVLKLADAAKIPLRAA